MRSRTIRSLLRDFPKIGEYYYKWRNTDEPELERDLEDVLSDYNYRLIKADRDCIGEYNDIRGYYECRCVKL